MNATLYRISLADEIHFDIPQDQVMALAEKLHVKHGGVPKVEKQEGPESSAQKVVDAIAEERAALVPVSRDHGQICKVGRDRSCGDVRAAEEAGFSMKPPLYARGTKVIQLGVDNARASRLAYDELPSAKDAHLDLAATIQGERRRDFVVPAVNLRMMPDGGLTTKGKDTKGISPTERAFKQLVNRLDIKRGASYLASCPPYLRAINLHHWLDEMAMAEAKGVAGPEVQLRVRTNGGGKKEVFAITSPGYTSYDADSIAQAVADASPANARGVVHYDGQRSRGDVLFHTTVQPEHFVAGEVFRAGVSWSTDDTGGGSIVCRAVVFQNLCLNLIIIDQAERETLRLRHMGSVEKLADGFRLGFLAALGKIDHFVKAWDVACEQGLRELAQPVKADEPIPFPHLELFQATVRGMLDRELIVVPGRKEDIVRGMARAWEMDDSGAGVAGGGLNRAALANAMTRYAHEIADNLDPRDQAGPLVYGEGRYARLPVLGA